MKCYNCGCNLSEHSFCTNCGAEVGLYKKIIRTSNYFYNDGLARAKIRDMSGAIVSLRESLKFNKNNIKARNLLGLVYFEIGEVPAALSEWVISSNLKNHKNIATDYIDRVQSNAGKLEQINLSIKKYNTALESCKQDAVDMAAIQLRNIVNKNPKFVRALQLYSLILLRQGKPEEALVYLEKCREVDVCNSTTIRYIQEVNRLLKAEEDKKKKKNNKNVEEPSRYTDGTEVVIQPPSIKEHRGSNALLNIIFGMAIGLAIGIFLILPGRIQQERADAQESIKAYGTQLDAKNLTIGELEKTNSEQADKIVALTESLSAYSGTEGTLLAMDNLLKAASIYLSDPENYLEVADYITSVDEESFNDNTSENYKALYFNLKSAIGPRVCDAYYIEGNTAYKNKQYEDAIAYLEAAVFFDATDMDALYQLANAYEAADKNDEAKSAYTKVTQLFPNTWYSSKAEKALNNLN